MEKLTEFVTNSFSENNRDINFFPTTAKPEPLSPARSVNTVNVHMDVDTEDGHDPDHGYNQRHPLEDRKPLTEDDLRNNNERNEAVSRTNSKRSHHEPGEIL